MVPGWENKEVWVEAAQPAILRRPATPLAARWLSLAEEEQRRGLVLLPAVPLNLPLPVLPVQGNYHVLRQRFPTFSDDSTPCCHV
ncbi:hypothetical protein E2C01_068016 [Portunus trituberculatus]|uniref:Uncharacterized protein n=1 Tax=Portunus trituberculatus TaxID=210409 RepID=A0A5B7HMM3_PORTR|nr:hypothetical protein [Portunus trituberculatus]